MVLATHFLAISDGRARIQIYIRQDSLPALDFQIFQLLDFGDWIGVEGRLFRTRTNELTIWASRLHFLAKCLVPLPEKWHGLTDIEIRYTDQGRIPLTAWHWPSAAGVRGRWFSDNVVMVARRP